MGEDPHPLLQVHMLGTQEPGLSRDSSEVQKARYLGLKRWQWWFLVALNIVFLLVGQSAATLLGRFYYDQGGNSKWMATLVQTAAFPILYLPLFFIPSSSKSSSLGSADSAKTSLLKISLIYLVLGLVVAANNMMYSVGLLYLSVSTYSLLCATQLAFNAVFSYFINSQKFTALILNSVIILTLSATLLAVRDDSSEPTGVAKGKYILGFISTMGASALYSLLLCLMQYTFEKILKKQTFAVVLEMQIYTSLVASCACVVGLFVSGEWNSLTAEMNGFHKGQVSYVMTLVWTAISWQICSVGVVGLIFVVSSLFSNVISTFALPLLPVAAVITFHDKMDGVKVVAMLLAIWGTTSYIYQHYIDDSKSKEAKGTAAEDRDASTLDRNV